MGVFEILLIIFCCAIVISVVCVSIYNKKKGKTCCGNCSACSACKSKK